MKPEREFVTYHPAFHPVLAALQKGTKFQKEKSAYSVHEVACNTKKVMLPETPMHKQT